MTLPSDTRLNDTPAAGPLTAADFNHEPSPELIVQIKAFIDPADPMALPRRATMDFRPASYEAAQAAHAASEIDDEDARGDCSMEALTVLIMSAVVLVGFWAFIGLAKLLT